MLPYASDPKLSQTRRGNKKNPQKFERLDESMNYQAWMHSLAGMYASTNTRLQSDKGTRHGGSWMSKRCLSAARGRAGSGILDSSFRPWRPWCVERKLGYLSPPKKQAVKATNVKARKYHV